MESDNNMDMKKKKCFVFFLWKKFHLSKINNYWPLKKSDDYCRRNLINIEYCEYFLYSHYLFWRADMKFIFNKYRKGEKSVTSMVRYIHKGKKYICGHVLIKCDIINHFSSLINEHKKPCIFKLKVFLQTFLFEYILW
jgi:hypothetical protein